MSLCPLSSIRLLLPFPSPKSSKEQGASVLHSAFRQGNVTSSLSGSFAFRNLLFSHKTFFEKNFGGALFNPLNSSFFSCFFFYLRLMPPWPLSTLQQINRACLYIPVEHSYPRTVVVPTPDPPLWVVSCPTLLPGWYFISTHTRKQNKTKHSVCRDHAIFNFL